MSSELSGEAGTGCQRPSSPCAALLLTKESHVCHVREWGSRVKRDPGPTAPLPVLPGDTALNCSTPTAGSGRLLAERSLSITVARASEKLQRPRSVTGL